MSKPELKVRSDGYKEWRLNGLLHREDGPAIIHPDGRKSWWINGALHREDGPAVIWPNGFKKWYLNGRPHREDGPAVIHSNGSEKWYLNGEYLSFNEYKSWFLNKVANPFYELTDGDIEFIREYLE